MRRSIILDVVISLVFHSALMLALFLLFSGHNRPGGGFVGGLVAGAAICLRYVAGGLDEVKQTVRLRPWPLVGVGLLFATVTSVVPLLAGGQMLEHGTVDIDLGPVGVLHASSTLTFDIGVALVVVGMVLMLLVSLGGEPERDR